MDNKKTLGDLRTLLKIHIQMDSNMVGHLSIMEPTAIRLNAFVDHIMGSVHLFPSSHGDTLFYKKLYQVVQGMAYNVLCEVIEEHTSAKNRYYDRIKGVTG